MTRVIFIRATQVAIDLLVLAAAFGLAFLLRFEFDIPYPMLKRFLFLWPYVVGMEYFLLLGFGVPRFVWRYVGLREAVRMLAATGGATAFLVVMRIAAGVAMHSHAYAQYAFVPFGVIAVNFGLTFLGVSGVRVARRILAERLAVRGRQLPTEEVVRTLLVGAGEGGLLVAKEIQGRPDLGVQVVGFLDDDRAKKGTTIHGIPVLGSCEDVAEIAQKKGATQAIITISNAPGSAVRRISDLCGNAGLTVKIIPGVYEIVGGKINLSRIRDIAIEDLLRRDPVTLDDAAINQDLHDQIVMVTGAGGSIGSELCRQVCQFGPKRLILVERSENALFEIHSELGASFPEVKLVPCIADVCERERVEHILRTERPYILFHAAAHKHVPMMEWNPGEAIKNNVFGTRLLADLADACGVKAFVMISTDKAVNPTSVMGASKRLAEVYIQALSRTSRTRFVTVRFGNVLGSAGSVVPIFKRQIAEGGPITVTHPDMKRYFMTIPEATQLVLQAGSMGKGGEIFILDMGEPVLIVDLARDLIRLSGFRPDDIEIRFSGVRPGEKLFEELSVADEAAEKTRHPKIFVGRTVVQERAAVLHALERMLPKIGDERPEAVRLALAQALPEYHPEASASVPPPAVSADERVSGSEPTASPRLSTAAG